MLTDEVENGYRAKLWYTNDLGVAAGEPHLNTQESHPYERKHPIAWFLLWLPPQLQRSNKVSFAPPLSEICQHLNWCLCRATASVHELQEYSSATCFKDWRRGTGGRRTQVCSIQINCSGYFLVLLITMQRSPITDWS